MLFAYIRRGRKALTLLNSQPCLIAKSLAKTYRLLSGPQGALRRFRSRSPSQQAFGSVTVVLSMTMFSIAMNVVHVYTHP